MTSLVLLLGLVSLFADMTYEGARSITGPFMGLLGANGFIVATVAGLGEFLGYGVRLISGKITDRTKLYWPITLIGYCSNLIVVPLLALAQRWEIAAFLIVLERVGKGIRTPARDAMLSYASKEMGRGWGFGIHEAMDRLGALLGPIFVFIVMAYHGSYRSSFVWLAIPAAFALVALGVAKKNYPTPQTAEDKKVTLQMRGFSRAFWIFLMASGFVAAGYFDFALISYHFQKQAILPASWIPLFYTAAMVCAMLFSLIGGKLFDRFSKPVLLMGVILGALSSPCLFWGSFEVAFLGMILWGLGLGMQGSVLRSIVASLTPSDRRSAAYGTFGVVFGFCWFLGSTILGLLYDASLSSAVAFSIILQLVGAGVFFRIKLL